MNKAERIHKASMEILAKTGMKILYPKAVQICRENGIKVEGETVYFTEEQIMHWIGKAPKSFTMYGRDSEYDVTVGAGNGTFPAPAFGAAQIMNQEGERRFATIDDYIKFVKLYEASDSFKINGGVACQPYDIPHEWSTAIMFYTSFLYSRKCLAAATGTEAQVEAMMELACAAYGGKDEFMKYPRLHGLVNTLTPMVLDPTMAETLFTFAKYNQPVVIASLGMAGATVPITLAGAIALSNAEVLAVIALSQMIQPGLPVFHAIQTSTMDLRNCALAIGAPEAAVCHSYCAKLGKFYGLPTRAGGCIGDAKIVNGQAGYESMMIYLSANMHGIDVATHSAGILDGFNCMSYEKMIMDFEVIDFVNRYLRDVEIDDERFALEVIDEVGPGGEFVTSDHTLDFCRIEPLTPKISVRGTTANVKDQFELNIEKEMQRLYSVYVQPDNDSAVVKEMQDILAAKGVSRELLEHIAAL